MTSQAATGADRATTVTACALPGSRPTPASSGTNRSIASATSSCRSACVVVWEEPVMVGGDKGRHCG